MRSNGVNELIYIIGIWVLRRIRVIVIWAWILLRIILSVFILASTTHASDEISSDVIEGKIKMNAKSPFSVDQTKENNDSPLAFPTSSEMSQAAQALFSEHPGDAARSMTAGEASGALQQWLSNFGTARIQLDMDRHGNWSRSSGDLLIPLYDNQKSLLFIQGGARKPSDRLTGNLGYGVRTFWQNGWMFGGNAFFDEDFTGHNRRVGIGVEAWRDYLRLSANTYVGTTNWHHSRDFDDNWQEKPASGYDVRAEGWLPAYPQLGGKLMFEQYYGNKVSLFDKDHLQHNPDAVTAGVEYTPIPLVSFGVDQKQGKGEHDTQIAMGVHWSFGHDWRWQNDPTNVQSMRTLAGSRYELVNRNNEIILQYRKKPDQGLAHLTLSVTIDNSPADGVTHNVLQVMATNRDGQPVRNTPLNWNVPDNSVSLAASASVTDDNGIASVALTSTKIQSVPVTVQSGSVSSTLDSHFVAVTVSHIALAVTQDNAIADGNAPDTVVATLTDSNNRPVTGQNVNWKAPGNVTIKDAREVSNRDGKVTVHMVSTAAGSALVSATVGAQSAGGTVHFTGNAASARIGDLRVTTDGSPADGKASNTAQCTVTDANGNVLSGQSVTWSSDKSSVVFSKSAVTDSKGRTTVSYTDTTAESLTLTASLKSGTNANVSSLFVVDKNSARLQDMVVTSGAKASGSDTNAATVTVADAHGNLLANTAVAFSVTGDARLSAATVNTDSNGKAQITLTDISAETVHVTAKLATGSSVTKDSAFVVDLDNAQMALSTSSGAMSDGKAQNTATLTLKDSRGKPLANQKVAFSVSGSAVLASSSVMTDSDGEAVVTITDTTAETVTTTATLINGKQASAKLTFVNYSVTSLISSADNVDANSSDKATLTATIKDSSGNPVKETSVVFSVTGSAKLSASTVKTDSHGQAQVTIQDNVTESVTVTAKSETNKKDAGKSIQISFSLPVTFNAVIVNGHSFLNDRAGAFPRTGFKGASFTLQLSDDEKPANYNWSSSNPQVSVDSVGNVKFIADFATGTGSVTITASNKFSSGRKATFTFKVEKWFIHGDLNRLSLADSLAWCSGQGEGYGAVTLADISKKGSGANASRDADGALWDEWGNLAKYNSGWSDSGYYWAADISTAWQVDVFNMSGVASRMEVANHFEKTVCGKTL